MLYATGPWFLNIILAKSQDVIVNVFKTILQYSVLTSIKLIETVQGNALTNYPIGRVPFFRSCFQTPN